MAMEKCKESNHPLYLQIYEYYKNLIVLGRLKPGEKLPSIRRCALERQVSKTTIESSYMQLVAEGYIEALPGSGYYVSEGGFNTKSEKTVSPYQEADIKKIKPMYDFASGNVDYKSFNFDLWKRYMKSALRNTERLVAYGDPQGEYDLRVVLMNYVKETRGVVCSPEQIVVGAGVQSMLGILCSLTGKRSPICFTGNTFKQGKAIFEDRGFETYYKREVNDLSYFQENKVKMLYTFPSHMSVWGEVMSMKTRMALLEFAQKEDCLIIEDDYDSEFRYYTRPVPSLQSLDGGQKVVYIGSFSRLLLPSLRIAFMVLPVELMESYREKGHLYNQTASTAEQIALCQFIRDGHLRKQIKKTRKLYMNKSQELCTTIKEVFGSQANAVSRGGGFLVRFEVDSPLSAEELARKAEQVGVRLKVSDYLNDKGWPCLLLSCSGVDEKDFKEAMLILKKEFWGTRGHT